jgi:hypothetical protein
MNTLSAGNLLWVWEKGRAQHLVDRALLLLGAAEPEHSYDQLADWTVGQRDAAILRLRIATFGARLSAYLDCPECNARLEFVFDGRAFQVPCEPEQRTIEFGDFSFRLPTSRDLAQIVHETDPIAATRRLLALCCVQESVNTGFAWSDAMLKEIESHMAEADPQGDIELELACEICGHTWQTAFDIAAFFWEEIEAKAKRLLQEIHLLASSYGWSEQQILALSDMRRTAYLEMVRA